MSEVDVCFLDANTYIAKYLRMLTRQILTEGIVTSGALEVTEKGTPDMSVNVAAGWAFVQGDQSTAQGHYQIYNDATVNKAIAASDPTNPRKDRVIAQIKDSTDIGGAVDEWELQVLTGTPAASPSATALPDDALDLAIVDVAAAAATITNANITDQRSRIRIQNINNPTSDYEGANKKYVDAAGTTVYADKLNLKIIVNAANPTYQIDVDADGLNLYNASEEVKHANAVNITIDVTASGANGLDTGSEAANTWYSIWVIGKADGTVAGLLHADGTGVIGDLTLPAGYTYARRVGWVRNNASSHFLKCYWFSDGWVEWHSEIEVYNAGSCPVNTFTDLDCSAAAPPTARRVKGGFYGANGAWMVRMDGSNLALNYTNAQSDMFRTNLETPCSASQVIEWTKGASGQVNINIFGYKDNNI